MIYILDNGGQYSDHEIVFIETQLPASIMAQLVKVWRARGEIAAIVNAVEWRVERPQRVSEWLCLLVGGGVKTTYSPCVLAPEADYRSDDREPQPLSPDVCAAVVADVDLANGWCDQWRSRPEVKMPADFAAKCRALFCAANGVTT